MMNLEQAIAYGKRVGVAYYVRNSRGCIVGGSKTKAGALEMKKRMENEERDNPWTHGSTKFYIEEVR